MYYTSDNQWKVNIDDYDNGDKSPKSNVNAANEDEKLLKDEETEYSGWYSLSWKPWYERYSS